MQYSSFLNPKSKASVSPWEKYIRICDAGEGNNGSVHFCIPKADLQKVKQSLTSSDAKIFDSLSPSLVAVKVRLEGAGALYDKGSMAREVFALKAIATHQQEFPHNNICSQLLDSDKGYDYRTDGCQWMVLSISGLFSLKSLLARDIYFAGLHPELLCHIFIEMLGAFQFLHQTCNPPIAHNDFHSGNIIFNPLREVAPGFPSITLIDFGDAIMGAPENDLARDRRLFYSMIRHQRCTTPNAGDNEVDWIAFKAYMGTTSWRPGPSLDAVWEAVGEKAHSIREKVSGLTRQQIQEQIRQAAEENMTKLEEGFKSVMNN